MTPRFKVLIRGDGMAAACCAHLLRRSGVLVRTERLNRPRIPALMLSRGAQDLIAGVFERPELFAGLHPIARRVVAWNSPPTSVPHAAVVASEDRLICALSQEEADDFDGPPDFTIHTAAARGGEHRRFGSRQAVAAEVRLKDERDHEACWMESGRAGWVFLVPNPRGRSWLLGVGAGLDQLLAESLFIAGRIDLTGVRTGAFDASPRLAVPLVGGDWLACGGAAAGFDPICGEGAAQAIREAVLAAAVVTAIADGGESAPLLAHYQAMLTAAMRRHLQLSARYYETGGDSPWWAAALSDTAEGYRWCTARLAAAPEPQFVLNGFRLEERGAAA